MLVVIDKILLTLQQILPTHFMIMSQKLSDHVSTTQMLSQAWSMVSQRSMLHAERKFWGDELLLARASRIFVMTRRLGLTRPMS